MATTSAAGRFGHFQLEAVLGRGGMATVYRAVELSGPRQGWTVALKRLHSGFARDPDYVQLFEDEASLCRHLRHPNIVTLYDAGEEEGELYLVTEFVDGGDLARVLQRCRARLLRLPVPFAVQVARELALGLAAAHEAVDASGTPLHVVHCDVSPSNVFVSRRGEVKLGDFGVARAVGTDAGRALAGKPFYASPELLDGKVGPGVDLWAACCVLYELLTNERPFGGDAEQASARIRAGDLRRAQELRPEVEKRLGAVLEKGLAKRESKRFQTAAELADALERLGDPRVATREALGGLVQGLG